MTLGVLKGKSIARFKGQYSRGFEGGDGVIPCEFLTRLEQTPLRTASNKVTDEVELVPAGGRP